MFPLALPAVLPRAMPAATPMMIPTTYRFIMAYIQDFECRLHSYIMYEKQNIVFIEGTYLYFDVCNVYEIIHYRFYDVGSIIISDDLPTILIL